MQAQSKKLLALLVAQAGDAGTTVSYADVARKIGIHVCNLKHPMDHLSRTLEAYAAKRGAQIPPIQILVVNGKTGRPGPGASVHIRSPYVKEGEQYATASASRQKEIAQAVYAAVLAYGGWGKVVREVEGLL